MNIFRSSVLALGLVTSLSAQEEGKPKPVPGQPPPVQQQTKEERIDAEAQAADEASGEVVNPDGTVTKTAHAPGPSLANFAGFVVSTKPARLAPGQSGTLIVVVSLQGDAIVVPGGTIGVTYPSTQGPITLGAFTVRPPKPGTLYKAFLDRPIHEKVLQIEIPISVQGGTAYDRYPVHLELALDMTSGGSGDAMGTKKGPVSHQVLVGNPMPTPVPLVGAVPANVGTAGPADTTPAGPADTTPRDTVQAPGNGVGAAAPTPGDAPRNVATSNATDGVAPAAPTGGDQTLLYVVAGVAALGFVVLLLARKR